MVPPMPAPTGRTKAADPVPHHPKMDAAASVEGGCCVGALAVGRETPTRYHIVRPGRRAEARVHSRVRGRPESAPP